MARRTGLVADKDLGLKKIIAQTRSFEKSSVLIGFQAGSMTKVETQGTRAKKGGLSMPGIAAANEFGTQKIPERSFMRTSFDDNVTNIQALIQREYGLVTDGTKTAKKGLGLIGIYVVGLIQQKIRAIVTPPNSPVTIALKGSSKPLIDFGQMVNSVTYVVTK